MSRRGVTLTARVRGAGARAMARLPASVLRRLAGPPVEVDGCTLDPGVQLLMRFRAGDGRQPLTSGSPAAARQRHRDEVLGLARHRTPVGEVRDVVIPGPAGALPARLYTPPGAAAGMPLLVFFHGGGYMLGDLDTYDEVCRLLCVHGAQHVLSVAYRLAPEHPCPAAADDCAAAFQWALAHAASLGGGAVAVGGDSAGGTLAAVVARRTAQRTPPAAQLLIYPSVDRTCERPSATLFDGYFLSVPDRDAFAWHYHRTAGIDDAHPDVSPLAAVPSHPLAPAFVVTAGFDVLRDEGEAYAAALGEGGTPVLLRREASLPHGFILMTQGSAACLDATVRLARSWRDFLQTRRGGASVDPEAPAA